MTIVAHRPEDMRPDTAYRQRPRPAGWGSYGGIHNADNPPGAPKISSKGSGSGGMLRKGRLGTEHAEFLCQNCHEKPADKQMPKCDHIICQDCLVDQGGECPLC